MAEKTERIEFDSAGVTLVGTLCRPAGADAAKRHPAVVITPPAHQIKEQTCAVYGRKLCAQGYVTLAFDYNSKGESQSYRDGVRNDENLPRKQEDLRNAISYLGTLDFIDAGRIYGLGICGGGTIMSGVVITDLRIKAFASVSGMMATDMMMTADADAFRGMITAANAARQRMFAAGAAEHMDLFGYDNDDYEKNAPGEAQLEGFHYYGRHGRAGSEKHPRFSNQVLASIYETAALNLGEHYADKILQPYLGIVGEKAEFTAPCTQVFFDKITAEKEMFVVPGATHVDLYDKDEFVDVAVGKIAAFFAAH